MAVVIRMARHGSKKKPYYRVVAADKECPRDGRFLEVLGTYNPKTESTKAELNQERLQYWISKGARPSGAVNQLLKRAAKQ